MRDLFGKALTSSAFWSPERLSDSAWLEHAPFAFAIIERLKPDVVVELGTHKGFSYLAFCQAVARLGLPTRCYAVDTWRGDEHAGFYGDEVLAELSAYHDERYGAFSSLLRMSFDAGLEVVRDGSVDLLHIDGRHFYDDVKHDFMSWRPKLSDRAVVLFHDTNVHERGFGVHRLWDELRDTRPSFEFLHGHGLGVLACGREPPAEVLDFLQLSADPDAVAQTRAAYRRLGAAVSNRKAVSDFTALSDSHQTEAAAARSALARCRKGHAALTRALSARDGELADLRAILADGDDAT